MKFFVHKLKIALRFPMQPSCWVEVWGATTQYGIKWPIRWNDICSIGGKSMFFFGQN